MSKILIFGAGSIGVFLGTKLASAGHAVILLGRRKLRALPKTITINGVKHRVPPRIFRVPAKQSFDYVFLTSKLYDLRKNLQLIRKSGIRTPILATIQNGLVDEKIYKPYLGGAKHASISVFEGFRLSGNQLQAAHSRTGWKTEDNENGRRVAKLLQSAGINCQTAPDLESIKAEKTLINCAVNVLSAIERKTVSELAQNPETRARIDRLFDESYEIISHEIKLRPRETLRRLLYQTIEPMRHYTSTAQDVMSGRRTEADFLNGYIVKLARKHKIQVPENKKLLEEFKKLT